MHPPSPYNNVDSFVVHLTLACTRNFPIITGTSPETNIVSGGEGNESLLQTAKSAKCPRTFVGYCLVLKFFKTHYTCNVLVGQGVIDGAENDGDI